MTTRQCGIVLVACGVALALFNIFFVYLGVSIYLPMRQEVEDSRQRFLASLGLNPSDPNLSSKLGEMSLRDANVRDKTLAFLESQRIREEAIQNEIEHSCGLWNLGVYLNTFGAPAHVTGFTDFWPGFVQVSLLLSLGGYWAVLPPRNPRVQVLALARWD